MRRSLVKDAEPKVDSEELMKAVDKLVEENLLSYVDPFTVSCTPLEKNSPRPGKQHHISR